MIIWWAAATAVIATASCKCVVLRVAKNKSLPCFDFVWEIYQTHFRPEGQNAEKPKVENWKLFAGQGRGYFIIKFQRSLKGRGAKGERAGWHLALARWLFVCGQENKINERRRQQGKMTGNQSAWKLLPQIHTHCHGQKRVRVILWGICGL